MSKSIYEVILNKILNSNLKTVQQERLTRLLRAIIMNNGKLYIAKGEYTKYLTLATQMTGGMNSTGFRLVEKQGDFSNSFRDYTDLSFGELNDFYDANSAIIEREIAKNLSKPSNNDEIIASFSKKISEMTDISGIEKERALATLIALNNSENKTFYLIKPNSENNYSYEEYLVTAKSKIVLVKHTIADGSNGVKDSQEISPTDLIIRLNELDNDEKKEKIVR